MSKAWGFLLGLLLSVPTQFASAETLYTCVFPPYDYPVPSGTPKRTIYCTADQNCSNDKIGPVCQKPEPLCDEYAEQRCTGKSSSTCCSLSEECGLQSDGSPVCISDDAKKCFAEGTYSCGNTSTGNNVCCEWGSACEFDSNGNPTCKQGTLCKSDETQCSGNAHLCCDKGDTCEQTYGLFGSPHWTCVAPTPTPSASGSPTSSPEPTSTSTSSPAPTSTSSPQP